MMNTQPKGRLLSRLIASGAFLLVLPASLDAALLYRWDFTGASGVPATTAGGGTLSLNGTASFTDTGVSGLPGDNAFNVTNAYTGGVGAGNSTSTAAPNVLTGVGTLSNFTVTMWVKVGPGSLANFPRLFELGNTATPDSGSNPGVNLLVNNGSLEIGVNSRNAQIPVGFSAGVWRFIAFSYDGTATNPYFVPGNNTLYGVNNNAVVLTGTASSSVAVAGSNGLNTGAPTFGITPGPAAINAAATLYLGNRAEGGRGLTGSLDDVRIYNTQLTLAELEAIRLESAPPPPPGGTPSYWKGGISGAWNAGNWTSDLAGTVVAPLPVDGSAAATFAALSPLNMGTTLLSADQSVKSLHFNTQSTAVGIGGTHNLTLGDAGITLDPDAGVVDINTSGQVILGANQTWTNKGVSPLTVASPVSGAFTLTTAGPGVTILSGANTHAAMKVESGTLRLGNALGLGPVTTSLEMGGGTLDLNGLNPEIAHLTGSTLGIITNTAEGIATLTVNSPDLSADVFTGHLNNGSPTQILALTKSGLGTQSLSSTGNFTGDVLVSAGTLRATTALFGAPNASNLGNAQTAGRTITATSGGTLLFASNNVLGNQAANFTLLPTIALEGGTLNATRYNTIGPVVLDGGTLTQASTDGAAYAGFQFKGDLTAEGGTTSVITTTNGKGNHLDANTNFIVASGSTLEVSAPLLNRSGDFASGSGGLTKDGPGTLVLGALNPTSGLNAVNTFTGETFHYQGTLQLDSNACLSDFAAFDAAAGAAIVLNFTGEEIVADFQIDDVSQGTGTFGRIGSGAETELAAITGDGLILVPGDPYASWIETYFPVEDPPNPDAARGADPDGDGQTNIEEFAFNEIPNGGAVIGRFRSRVETVGANQALVITLPVRDGAVFDGNNPAAASLLSEQIAYEISGSNDLADFNQPVTQVTPALAADLPGLDFGWSYRTFRLNGNVGGATPRGPKGFLRATVTDTAP